MRYFEDMDGKLIFRDTGEPVQIEVWGKDSLRVRSRMLGDIKDEYSALTEKIESITPVIRIAEDNKTAELTNGKLRAYLSRGGWGGALQITFYNEKGQILLREIPNGGALSLKARY